MLQADVRSALHFAAAVCYLNPVLPTPPPPPGGGASSSSSAAIWKRTKTKRNHILYSNSISMSPFFTRAASSLRPVPSTRVEEDEEAVEKKASSKKKNPSICTADELHYVPVPGTDWRLALWRYLPPPNAPVRNHPLLLLSGVGTNAIGYDLSPESSFARSMCSEGFDTWILEVRGAGLSMRKGESEAIDQSADDCVAAELIKSVEKGVANGVFPTGKSPRKTIASPEGNRTGAMAAVESEAIDQSADDRVAAELITSVEKGVTNGVFPTGKSPPEGNRTGATAAVTEESQLATKLTETLLRLSERVSGFLNEGQSRIMSAKFFDQMSKLFEDTQLSERFNEIRRKLSGLLEARQNSAIANQIRDLSQRLVNIVGEGQRSVSPQFFDVQERLYKTIEDFQKQLDLIVKYDWDFDNYLDEDVPAAMEYIRTQCKPKDGKLLAIGHSMGGILLYAMLSRYGFEGKTPGLAGVVTLASSLDYTSSNSSLKLLLPIADPAQALNVPVVPLGALLAAVYPLSSRPPYILAWLNPQISAEGMMHPEMFEKLVLNNFCTVPFKLLLQLTTVFRNGGLRDRSGTFCYKDHLHKSNVPILAVAGDQDLICPPEAVYETVKIIPQHLVTYKLFGRPNGPHYGHYDLVGGRLAIEEVYPCIIEFLSQHDQ
ncbi:hypothetical protein AAC387_Pa02g0463 [Persea americana]